MNKHKKNAKKTVIEKVDGIEQDQESPTCIQIKSSTSKGIILFCHHCHV